MDRLSLLWKALVSDLEIPGERCKEIELAAVEAHALLTDQSPDKDKKKKNVNFLDDAEIIRHRLIKEGRLFAYMDIFSAERLPISSNRPEDIAVILYTSGTTGRSKGAMLSHKNIVSNIQAAIQRFQLNNNIQTLSFLPINHVFEQVCGILLPLSLGGRVSFAQSIKKLGDNLAEIKPTFLLGVPAVFKLLLDRIMKTSSQNRHRACSTNLPLHVNSSPARFSRRSVPRPHLSAVGPLLTQQLRRAIATWASTSSRATVSPRPLRLFRQRALSKASLVRSARCSTTSR